MAYGVANGELQFAASGNGNAVAGVDGGGESGEDGSTRLEGGPDTFFGDCSQDSAGRKADGVRERGGRGTGEEEDGN
jgi:hypothetical protein